MGARSISTNELRAECTLLERVCMSERLISKEQTLAQRPGGAENPDKTAKGWLNFYRWLTRQHAKVQHDIQPESRAIADATVMDALRGKPIPVKLPGSDADWHVYPKSLDALLQIHALDIQLSWMVKRHAALVAMNTPEAMDLIPTVMAELTYTYHLLCWTVTHPGPGMPFAEDDAHPTPPEKILALEPWDCIRIVQAHHTHLSRLAALTSLIDEKRQGDDGGKRPSWSMFIGTIAAEHGADPVVYMKNRDLPSLLAAVRLRAAATAPREKADANPAGSGRAAMAGA